MKSELGRFEPRALFAARAFRGMTVSELASQSGVARQTVSSLENGSGKPFPNAVEAIADTLGFPIEFFYRPIEIPEEGVLHFRRQTGVSVKSVDRARASAALMSRVTESFREFARFTRFNVPDTTATDIAGIERAAESLRAAVGIDRDAPIVSAIRVVEKAGIHVALFDPGDVPVDGFCWANSNPVIMLSTKSVWSRRRFSVMHEAGHLLLHRKSKPLDSEEQAHMFAGAILLPRVAFYREFPRARDRFDWPAILQLKHRWGASVQAMIRRAYDLGIINSAQYRTANIHIAKFGWKTNEPGEREPEIPEVCSRFAGDIKDRGIASSVYNSATLFESNVQEILMLPDDDRITRVIPIRRRQGEA